MTAINSSSATLSVVLAAVIVCLPGCNRNRSIPDPPLPPLVESPSLVSMGTSDEYTGPPILKVGEPQRFGETEVMVQRIELLDEIGIEGYGDVTTEKGTIFCFSVLIKNVSEGQVFYPYIVCTDAIDNFGNRMAELAGSGECYVGSQEYTEIRPGETAKTLVCLMPKIETATECEATMSTKKNNQSDDYARWRVKFSVSDLPLTASRQTAQPITSP